MKAIILAAGESKRLKPITNKKPKFLLQVGEKTIIDYQIDNLKKASVYEAVFVLGFKAEMVKEHLLKNHPDFYFTFIISEDYYKTYPAHGLWLAKEYLKEQVLYLNADVICHPEIIKRVVNDKRHSITAIQKTAWDEEEVNVILKKDTNEVIEMGKHVSRHLTCGEFIGVTKIGKVFCSTLIDVLDGFIEKKEFKKFAADSINLAIQRGQKMYALDVSKYPAIEIDTKEDLDDAKNKVKMIKWEHHE